MEPDQTQVSALVLAGGSASRFGSDKTRADLFGRTVLERTLDAVAAVVGQVVVIGPWSPPGIPHFDEPPPRRGPAAALAFGMQHVDGGSALVIGADHPLLEPALLGLLVARMGRGGVDAVVPTRDSRDEPLVACYRRSVGGVAADVIARGESSLRAVLATIRVDRVAEHEWRGLGPEGRSFLDVDTPHDLDTVRDLLSSRRHDVQGRRAGEGGVNSR